MTTHQLMLGSTPSAAPPTTDPYFEYVTTLLHGDGTNGAQNNTFLDSSTNNFTITRNGNTTQGTFSPYGANWSNYFNGDGNYLSAPYTVFTSVSGDFTIEAWVNASDAGRTQDANKIGCVVCGGAANSITNIWNVNITIVGNAITVVTFSTNDVTRVTATGQSFPINEWHHIAVVRSGTTVTLYVDGSSIASATYGSTFTTNTAGTIQIARNAYASTYQNWLKGYISNVRLINGTAVYTSNFTPSTTPLVATDNTKLLTCQSNTFVDNSAGRNAITRTGTVTVQRFSPFAPVVATPYYSNYFDGTGDYLTVPDDNAFFFGTGDYTVETFVYFNNIASAPWLIGQWVAPAQSDTNSSWQIATAGSKFTAYVAYNNSTSQISLTGTTTLVNGTWYHVALVRNGTTHTLYVNGVSEASSTVVGSNTLNNSSQLVLFGRRSGGTLELSGYMSNTRVVKGVAVYTSNFTTPTSPLTAISGTSLLTCQSSTFIDNSTNNFAITATGNTIPTTFAPFTVSYTAQEYSPSVIGGSGYFDGTGDSLVPQSSTTFQLGSGDFTIECWEYLTSSNVNQCILDFRNTTTATLGFFFGVVSSGYLQVYANANILNINAGIGLNYWHHIALVRSGTTLTAYLNGVNIGSTTNSTNWTDYNLRIGSSVGSAQNEIGYLTDVKIVKGLAVYKSNFVPSSSPNTASANTILLLNCTNAGILDNAEMINFETAGNAQVSTSIVKYGTGSMYFDGTGDYLTTARNLSIGTSSFTFEGWIYPTALVSVYNLICSTRTSSGADGTSIAVTTANKLAITTSGTVLYTSTASISLNTWTYFAFCRDGTTACKVFINGNLDGSFNDARNYTGKVLLIGGGETGNNAWTGYIDDFRLTLGVARYSASFTAPTAAFPNQ